MKNINLNYENNYNYNIVKIFFIIIIIIISYIGYESYIFFEEKKEKDKLIKEQIREYNKLNIEKEKLKKEFKTEEKTEAKTEAKEENNKKYKNFKISYEIINKELRSFNSGIYIIIDNLKKIKSEENENNYKIEIIGYITEYGNFFYNLNKRKTSNKYDEEFTNTLNELKKIKFKKERETINFKIFIDNDNKDLNWKYIKSFFFLFL